MAKTKNVTYFEIAEFEEGCFKVKDLLPSLLKDSAIPAVAVEVFEEFSRSDPEMMQVTVHGVDAKGEAITGSASAALIGELMSMTIMDDGGSVTGCYATPDLEHHDMPWGPTFVFKQVDITEEYGFEDFAKDACASITKCYPKP